MNATLRRLIVPLIAVACYLVSFFLPTLYLTGKANTDGKPRMMIGAECFFDGFWAMFDRQYAWLANPLAGLALISLLARQRLAAGVLALAALLVAQHAWKVVGTQISGDEGGVTQFLVNSIGPGFYVWSASFLLLAVASAWTEKRNVL